MADKTAEHRVVQSKSQLQNSSVSDTALQEDSDARGSSDGQKLTGDVIPKKRSTFKITSVTTTHTTPNSRGGDSIADQDGDSLDDLDESHTEDLSSDIYDLSSRIPDLDQDMLLTPEEVISKEKPSDSQSRFKVVKIETKEPFRRGRWFCHDYLDPPVDSKLDKQGDEIMVHSGNSSAGNSVHYVHGVDDPSKNPLLAGGTGTIPVSLNMSGTEAHNSVAGESFKPIHPASHPSQQPASQVTHIQSQRQSTPGLASADTSTSNPVPSQQQVPSNTTVSHPSVQSGNNQNPPGQSNSSQSIPLSNAQSVPQMPQSMNVKQSEQPYSHTPSAYGAQTGQISNNAMQPGSHYPEQQTFNSQPYSLTNINIPAQTPQPQAGQTSASNAPLVANASIDSTTNVNTQNQMAAPGSAVPSATVQQPTVQQTILTNPPSQSLSATLSTGNLVGIQVNPSGEPLKENNSTTTSDKSEMLSNYGRRASMPDYKDIRTTEELQTLVQESSGIPDLTGPLLSVVVGRNSPARETRDESEGGASAVAIDNKIEQAMDLVKSHLMFAVREEVEVLKEQIKELVEKIGQLEYENSILRAAATPETLAKLQQQKALPPSSTS